VEQILYENSVYIIHVKTSSGGGGSISSSISCNNSGFCYIKTTQCFALTAVGPKGGGGGWVRREFRDQSLEARGKTLPSLLAGRVLSGRARRQARGQTRFIIFSELDVSVLHLRKVRLGQEFGSNNNSYISRTRFYLCESKIFAIAFAAL
jgi:hypothetical protein